MTGGQLVKTRRNGKSHNRSYWPWIVGAVFAYVFLQPESAETNRIESTSQTRSSALGQNASLDIRSKAPVNLDHSTRQSPPASINVQYVQVAASKLNVRRSPSKNARVINGLARGSIVRVLDKDGSWALIENTDTKGWVFAEYLRRTLNQDARHEKASVETQNAIPDVSSSDIRRTLIAQSIAKYPGNCPCPYNTTASGRRCGGNSAYSRRGGYSPLCYENDISDQTVHGYLNSR